MCIKKKQSKSKLDSGEKNLLISIEKGGWKSVKNVKSEKKAAQRAAVKKLYE